MQQIQALNTAYGGGTGGVDTGVSFRLLSMGTVDNAQWFLRPHDYQPQMVGSLATGGPGTLNLFTAAVGSDVLGFSSFPQWYPGRPTLDGVVVDYRSLPGGPLEHFSRGYTAVHEIGHWLGLFHPFEGGCRRARRRRRRHPVRGAAHAGLPGGQGHLPGAGHRPGHNFMDYAYDSCMREFTAGQGLRIRAMWAPTAPVGSRYTHPGRFRRTARRSACPVSASG